MYLRKNWNMRVYFAFISHIMFHMLRSRFNSNPCFLYAYISINVKALVIIKSMEQIQIYSDCIYKLINKNKIINII